MKFMLMMTGTRKGWESLSTWSPDDFAAHIRFMKGLNKRLTESGELVAAEGLDVPANAVIVRARKGEPPAVTDGPFAEAKEFLAGFWIVDCESPARAYAIAAEASAAPGPGGASIGIPIEVRAVGSVPKVEE